MTARYLASVCAGCGHTYNFHASAGNCVLMTCTCVGFADQAADDSPITDENDEFYTGCTETCADNCQADHRGEQ